MTPAPPRCPYCNSEAVLVPGATMYPNADIHGWFWRCNMWPLCNAYVGCHEGTQTPLGTLANKELRGARQRAHRAFDALWQAKVDRHRIGPGQARERGYQWLAAQLGLPRAQTHIGMLDVDTCQRVVDICTPYLERLK